MADEKNKKEEKKIKCGLIMPISAIDGCDENHWIQVRNIIEETISEIGEHFIVRMVSERNPSDLIQSNIVQAIYEDEVAICDISGRNPNVMLELGMRIAFNKPVVIIFDGIGISPFDITNILQIRYPRDLNYWKMNEFKKDLKEKVNLALEEKENAFLKAFGKDFKTYELTSKKITVNENEEKILEAITDLKYDLNNINMKIFSIENRDIMRDSIEEKILQKLSDNYSNEKYKGMPYERFLEIVEMDRSLRRMVPLSKSRKIIFDFWRNNISKIPSSSYELR